MSHSQFTPTDSREPKLHLWTIEEYYRMGEVGVFQNQRVELIEGQVLEMSPTGYRYAVAVDLVADTLRSIINFDCHIREQMPYTIDSYSELEPDVAVIPGERRSYLVSHPKLAILIVEVADSTLTYDRTIKQNLYARVGVPEYWILNLIDEQLEVYRNPHCDKKDTSVYKYNFTMHQANQRVKPLTLDGFITVADLIP